MSFLEVDVEELQALAGRLRTLRDRFNTQGRDFGAYHEAVGSHRLNQRLAQVAGNWTHHREQLAAKIESVAAMVEAAAVQYQQTETEITASAAPGQEM